jgi:DNA polymerase elongation subunit (family B)
MQNLSRNKKEMNGYFYDIETYQNIFTFAFISISDTFPISDYIRADKEKDFTKKLDILNKNGAKLFIIHKIKNDIPALCKFIRNVSFLVGFNNRSFDDNIIDYIVLKEKTLGKMTTDLAIRTIYNFTREVLDDMFNRYRDPRFKRFVKNYRSIDLYKILRLDYSYTGLKQVAVNLKWYRVEDLPIHHTKEVEDSEIKDLVDYNFNDVLITRELYFKVLPEVIQRLNASAIYGTDFLASSRSSMADRIMSKLYCDYSGLKFWELRDLTTTVTFINFNKIISKDIQFESEQLQKFLFGLKRESVNVFQDKFNKTIIYDGTSYTFARGGLHTNDKPGKFESNDKYIYIDADVTSFYPRLILKNIAVPRHLDTGIFLTIFKTLVEERVEYKRLGDPLAEVLKIVINSIYGKLGDHRGWLYDLEALYKVTINGELTLLSLCEMLVLGSFKIISANTDGVLCRVPNDRLDDYYKICDVWSDKYAFDLEFNIYDKYVRLSVNDYLAVYNNGKIKTKGFFNIDFQPGRGYYMPVISKALLEYFVKGIKPETYIRGHTDIFDFCASIKTGEQFTKNFVEVTDNLLNKRVLPKTVRYYCSTKGGSILKTYSDKDKSISMLKGSSVNIINDCYDFPNDIDYNYYIKKTYENIYRISNIVTKDIKGTKSKSGRSGSMFDEI